MIINLEPKVDERVDPRQLQLTITGFLEKDAPAFMQQLWELLVSAQAAGPSHRHPVSDFGKEEAGNCPGRAGEAHAARRARLQATRHLHQHGGGSGDYPHGEC
jgi:hypothetical protein